MQMLNRFVGGRQEVGHIDLLDTISYFEVPEKDAKKVMLQLSGIRFKGRQVRCNDADAPGQPGPGKSGSSGKPGNSGKPGKPAPPQDDWRSLMSKVPRDLRGEEPDFSEEGWAMRKPRKKK